MTTAEIIGATVAIVGVTLSITLAAVSYVKYKRGQIVEKTKQDCKLDSIVENVTTIRDDVKALKGLDIKVEQLCTRVAHVEKVTSTAHRRIDRHLGVDKDSDMYDEQ